MTHAIRITNLTKVYTRWNSYHDFLRRRGTSKVALNEISLDIKNGEIFGLLGPNGAGKTTLIKILSTLVLPTSGSAKIYNYDVVEDEWRIKNLIGLIHSDERSFFWRLTGRQNLEFFAALFRLPAHLVKERIEEMLTLVGLQQDADQMFHYYSTGMKQKLAIARGLLTRPKVLFMDEPMRSLDPVSSQKIRTFVREKILDITKGAVVVATNRLDEASYLCDRVAVLNKGRIIACGSMDELSALSQNAVQYEIEVGNMTEEAFRRVSRAKGVQGCAKAFQVNGTTGIKMTLDHEEESLHPVIQVLIQHNAVIKKCSRRQPSFETVFQNILEQWELNHNRGPQS